MIKSFLMILIFLLPTLSFAQGGGHVGKGSWRNNQDQQQQQQEFSYRLTVTRGEEAKVQYEAMLTHPETIEQDLSLSCEAPVKSVSTYNNHGEYIQCFDRGDEFSGSRYKCYIRKEVKTTFLRGIKELLLGNRHIPYCGGGGIHSVKQEQ